MNELKAYPGPYYLQPDCILDHHMPISVPGHGAFASVVVEMNDYGIGVDEQAKKNQLFANACLLASSRRLYDALKNAVSRMEQDAVTIDHEFGKGFREIEDIDADGDTPEELVQAREALACARSEDPSLFSTKRLP